MYIYFQRNRKETVWEEFGIPRHTIVEINWRYNDRGHPLFQSEHARARRIFGVCDNEGQLGNNRVPSPPHPSPSVASDTSSSGTSRGVGKSFWNKCVAIHEFCFFAGRTNETENYIGRVSTNVRASMRVIHAPISFEKKTGSLPPPPETLANHVQRRSVKSFRRKIHFASETTIC